MPPPTPQVVPCRIAYVGRDGGDDAEAGGELRPEPREGGGRGWVVHLTVVDERRLEAGDGRLGGQQGGAGRRRAQGLRQGGRAGVAMPPAARAAGGLRAAGTSALGT